MMSAISSVPSIPSALWATIPSPLPEEPPIDPNLISPGLLGLAAFLFLIIAVALLFRSMRKQLGKVNQDLPEEPPREPDIPIVDDQGQAATDAAPADPTMTPPEKSKGGEPPAQG